MECGGSYAHDSIATESERKTIEVKTEEREITFIFGLLYLVLYLYTYINIYYFLYNFFKDISYTIAFRTSINFDI